MKKDSVGSQIHLIQSHNSSRSSISSSSSSGSDCGGKKPTIDCVEFCAGVPNQVDCLKSETSDIQSPKALRKNGFVYNMSKLVYTPIQKIDESKSLSKSENKLNNEIIFNPKFKHLPGWTPFDFFGFRAKQSQNHSTQLLLDSHPKRIFRISFPDERLANVGRSLLSSSFSSSLESNKSLDSHFSQNDSLYSATLLNQRRAYRLGERIRNNEKLKSNQSKKSVLFPSMRLLLAVLLCCCYITISISSSNIAVALICMIKCPIHGYIGDLEWQSDQEGIVLAAQNAGTLLILLIGYYADRINGKWMIGSSLLLCFVGNLALPLFAVKNFWYAVAGRLAIGASDAFMSSAVNSLITRWFPHVERAAAIGIITGGRQIGTLFILPTAGYLCTRTDIQGGWPAIFYLSSLISGLVFIFWLPMGADKPAKQYCISTRERIFIESRIASESIGKRTTARKVPWSDLLRSTPLWVCVFSLICHEYPLVIMLQFLPNYMRDVLKFAPTKNGALSALPILFLFISKTVSSSLSSWISVKTRYNSTVVCKVCNAIGSLGLSLSVFAVSQFEKEKAHFAIIALCFAMTFAGFHTPGVQTALLQLAPPFSGIVTGISFFCVAWFSIGNKILTKWIVQHGEQEEWATVFYISAIVAALPVFVFTLWGTDQRQWWAAPTPSNKSSSCSSNFFTSASINNSSIYKKNYEKAH